jgi:NADPH-dependent 2,4-dienoyl-CoA reductase/sulfur reductase-like enzyme
MSEPARETDVIVIGGGPAGLAAAAAASDAGANVVLVDRNRHLGGILSQCIHDGFGLHAFGETLTGPEFAERYVHRCYDAGVEVHPGALVVELTPGREVVYSMRGSRDCLRARSIVLAMGCRERTRGMLRIPGERPAGVYTAGTAQWLTNCANVRIGKRVVVLGSGDIGLIMSRRLMWEGVDVVGVVELLPYPSGLPRNVSQCLDDYSIPLHLSHSITYIHGAQRVEAVTVARFDEHRRPVAGTSFDLECDTVLLSVGLIPETELARRAGVALDRNTSGACVDDRYMTNVPGIFSCGNVLHIHDLADWAAEEGERAGRSAAQYARSAPSSNNEQVIVRPGGGVRYVVPQAVQRTSREVLLSFRVAEPSTDRTARLLADGIEFASKRLGRVHPATMVQWTLDCGSGLDARQWEVCLA